MTDTTNALIELNSFIKHMAWKCKQLDGWSYVATSNAPEGFKQLKEQTINRCIPIANYGCDSSIYDSPETNVLFRFYHDVTHLSLNEGFSKSGEYAVIDQHMIDGKAYGLSELALNILEMDTRGQVDYYFKHKEFVSNQLAFLNNCLELGLNNALEIKC